LEAAATENFANSALEADGEGVGVNVLSGKTTGAPARLLAIFALAGCATWALSIALSSNSVAQPTPSSTSLCNMANMRGTAVYNKYCGAAPATQTGGGFTPQQQMMLNGASNLGYALGSAFAEWLFSSDADQAQQQREAYMQELQRQAEEAERQQKIEQARQLQLMYNRLVATMKLHGLPDLQFKVADTGGGLQFKKADQSSGNGISGLPGIYTGGSGGYGISGLPGIYTGGPRDSQPSATASGESGDKGLTFKLGDSGSASAGSGYGIPGLPGIYTNGPRPAPANAGQQSGPASDFSKMTPDEAVQMAKAVSSLPADQQNKILAAAQGSLSNADSSATSGPGQSAVAGNSPTRTQLASIANSSRAAATAITPEEASSRARTGFDTPGDGNVVSAKLAGAQAQSAAMSSAAPPSVAANISPGAGNNAPAPCPMGFVSDDGVCKSAKEVLPATRDPAIAPGAPIYTAGLSQQCSIIKTEISNWAHVARVAVLASDVYDVDQMSIKPDRVPANGFVRVGEDDLRKMFPFSSASEIQSVIAPDDNGYRAAVYRDNNSGKYYIAYRGTREFSGPDWKANIRQAMIGGGVYYDKAILLAKMMARAVGVGNFEIVGHSLGGGLANAAGLVTGARTTAFNPAGVRSSTVDGAEPSYNNIESYVVSGEPLSSSQNSPVSPTVGYMPPTSGRVIVLPVGWSHAPPPLTLERHKLDTGVEPALRGQQLALVQASRSAGCISQAGGN
jgi:hypothetical protein